MRCAGTWVVHQARIVQLLSSGRCDKQMTNVANRLEGGVEQGSGRASIRVETDTPGNLSFIDALF